MMRLLLESIFALFFIAAGIYLLYYLTKKELRIEAMKPDIENGVIRFNKKHSILLEQFERYGQGGHDDSIDSLNMAVTSVVKSSKRKAGYAGTYRY